MAIRIEHDGAVRRFLLEYPQDWMLHAPLPLLVVLHDEGDAQPLFTAGWVGSSADEARDVWAFHVYNTADLATLPRDAIGRCVVIYPQAMLNADRPGWSVGHAGPEAADATFVEACIDHVEARFNTAYDRYRTEGSELARRGRIGDEPAIDPERIFLFGAGSGAAMALRIAVAPEPSRFPFKAIAVVNGTIGGWRHSRDRHAPLLETTWDPERFGHMRTVPFDPTSEPTRTPSVLFIRDDNDDYWASEALGPDSVSHNDSVVYETMGYIGGVELELARWDHKTETTVRAWVSYLFRRWDPARTWWSDGVTRVRLHRVAGAGLGIWDPSYRSLALRFFHAV